MYNEQILDNARAAGKSNFLMYGEICTRYTDVWYRGHAEESTPYYTWKESNSKWAEQWHWGTTAEDINANMNLTFDHYLEEDDPSDQPTSTMLSLTVLHTTHPTEQWRPVWKQLTSRCIGCSAAQAAHSALQRAATSTTTTLHIM